MTNQTQTAQRVTVKHLDHLNLSVDDLAATADWYGRVFGFREVERGVCEDGTPWRILHSGEALLCCYEHKKGPARREHGLHGINHFSFRLTDEPAWRETVKREHVRIGYGAAIDYPHSRSWYVIDPSGYEIEVVVWKDDTVRFG